MMKSSTSENQTKVLYGDRISREGKVRLGCSLVLLNKARDSVLLTRRMDNGLWCLPGGMVDPGESVAETCEREMLEETGLRIKPIRLVGIYSDPNQLIVYPDGNKTFAIVLSFEVAQAGGTLGLSMETSEAHFFPVEQAVQMDLFHNHAEHLRDALAGRKEAIVK